MDNIVDLYSYNWHMLMDELRRVLEAGDLVLLLGSGISQFAPSYVPVGAKISARFREEMLARLPSQERIRVSYLTHKIPFEALMARLTELDASVARDVVLTLTTVTEPNGIHCQVANLIYQAACKNKNLTILTTNYDMGVSEALQKSNWPANVPQPPLVIRPQDVVPYMNERSIFHVHGATQDPDTFVLDYNTEFQLESWKRQYLSERLRGKTLLLLGFSGYDLDVCEALVTIGIKRLIWVQATRAQCSMETWSVGARNLADAVGHDNVISVNVNYHMEVVLEPLTFPVTLEHHETKIEERFQKVLDNFATPQQPWFTLWARWTAIRAGCWNLANSLTPTERALIPLSQQFEIESFGYYYAGQFAKGALLQRNAAYSTINFRDSLDRYLYHRNNEAEFFNRGGLTRQAFFTVMDGAWYYLLHYRSERKSNILAQKREIRNLLSSLSLLWPLPAIFVATAPLQAPFRTILRLMSRFNSSGDLDKFTLFNLASARPDQENFKRGEARFDWIGQRARLINIYRIYALRQLLTVRQKWTIELLQVCFERVYRSAQWASLINDPCRFGKGWLVLLEVNSIIRHQYPKEWELLELRSAARLLLEWNTASKEIKAIEYQGQFEREAGKYMTIMPLFDFQLSDEAAMVAPKAWDQIRRGEIGSIYIATAITLYGWGQKRNNRLGLLLRLLSLSLLETS